MYTPTPAAGEDVCADPGNYEKEWAFPQAVQTTPISCMGELEEESM